MMRPIILSRRKMREQPPFKADGCHPAGTEDPPVWFDFWNMDDRRLIRVKAPYRPGEVCWVRETWALVQIWTDEAGNADYIKEWTEKLPKELPKGWVAVYDAEWQEAHCLSRDDRFIKHWRSPVTMPRWAARRYVRILSIKPVEDKGVWRWEWETEEVERP